MKNILFGKNLKFLRESKNAKQSEMLTSIGFKRTTWNGYENEKSFPKTEDLIKIAEYFDISIDMLLFEELQKVRIEDKEDVAKYDAIGKVSGKVSGKVRPYKANLQPDNWQNNIAAKPSVISYNSMPQVVTVDNLGNENMVLVPLRARAGYLNGYGDTEYISHLPSYRLPNFNNGTFRMFEVGGLSMYPTFNDKDILITKFVESINNIKDDRVYVVVTNSEGVVVKRVLNRLNTDGNLILKSDTIKDKADYPNIVIQQEDVVEIWYCVAYMSRIMRAPAEMYARMIDLEGRLTMLEHNLKLKPLK